MEDHVKVLLSFTIVGLLFSLYTGLLWAEAPEIENKGKIQDGIVDLDAGYQSNPCVVDWNNDGLKDLLVGEATGYILLFLNQGTDLNPVFNGSTKIESNGKSIMVSHD